VTAGYNVQYPALIAVRDISYVIGCIKGGIVEGDDLRAQIAVIRGLQNPDLAKEMKRNLPWFAGSVMERRRSDSNVKFAWFAIFDLDHIEDIEAVKRQAIETLPFVHYAFRSVRDGVKLIAEFSRALTDIGDYRKLWPYLALRIEKALNLKPDNTPDWARACYYSHDPELIVNRQFQAVDIKLALQAADVLLEVEKMKATGQQGKGATGQAGATLKPGGKDADQVLHASTLPRSHDHQRSPDPASDNRSSVHPLNSSSSEEDFEKARQVVTQLAKIRIPYKDWVLCGLALYAGFGERGRELWDIFQSNPWFNDSDQEMNSHWKSFKHVHSTTIETLFYLGGKYGCE